MASDYEKQLEERVERLERQLQDSEKQQCRDFQKLKKALLEGLENNFAFGLNHVVAITWIKELELEDDELNETYENFIKDAEEKYGSANIPAAIHVPFSGPSARTNVPAITGSPDTPVTYINQQTMRDIKEWAESDN